MKVNKLTLVCLLLIGGGLIAISSKYISERVINVHELKSSTTIQKDLNQKNRKQEIQVLAQDQEVQMESLPSMSSMIDDFRTRTDIEVRSEINKLKLFLKTAQLIEKANDGSITAEERKKLAYAIRLNTALHHVLLDRELGI